jgi:hypothetical protein
LLDSSKALAKQVRWCEYAAQSSGRLRADGKPQTFRASREEPASRFRGEGFCFTWRAWLLDSNKALAEQVRWCEYAAQSSGRLRADGKPQTFCAERKEPASPCSNGAFCLLGLALDSPRHLPCKCAGALSPSEERGACTPGEGVRIFAHRAKKQPVYVLNGAFCFAWRARLFDSNRAFASQSG